jgi:GNAT superfamily N-acetyltransferase
MTLEAITKPVLHEQFVARPTTLDDAQAVFALYDTLMHEYAGGNNRSVEEIRAAWTTPGFDLGQSARSVFTLDGRLVAHIEVWDAGGNPAAPYMWGYVHPDFRGKGIGSYLVDWAERRARRAFDRVPPGTRVTLQATCPGQDQVSKELFELRGMTVQSQVWRMVIEMDREPAEPDWPEGITVTTLADYGDLRMVYIAIKEILQDVRIQKDGDFETGFRRFRHWVQNDPKHDPSLWVLALDGEQIIGLALGEAQSGEDPDKGFIGAFDVRREYRYPGVKKALLRHSFRAYWKRGQRKVGLRVDVDPMTASTRFFEKIGMAVERTSVYYEKELRPGG